MNRRRLALALSAAALAGGVATAHVAQADTATVDKRYWACLAIDHVEVGACLDNPLPDPREWPTKDEIVDSVTDSLPKR